MQTLRIEVTTKLWFLNKTVFYPFKHKTFCPEGQYLSTREGFNFFQSQQLINVYKNNYMKSEALNCMFR